MADDISLISFDSLSTELVRKCSVVKLPDNRPDISQIHNLKSLSAHLPNIASSIFKSLGSQQCEATYQRCLKIDLEEAGLEVELEKEIQLEYKGKIVGTRRADLLVKTKSKELAVIELKAVSSNLSPNHVGQLKYYMEHFKIEQGYLINFPHDDGFPRADDAACFFEIKALMGVMDLSTLDGPLLRLRHDRTDVQIIELKRRILNGQELKKVMAKKVETEPQTKWGITQKGFPCKICIKGQGFCHYHKHQEIKKVGTSATKIGSDARLMFAPSPSSAKRVEKHPASAKKDKAESTFSEKPPVESVVLLPLVPKYRHFPPILPALGEELS